MQRCDVFKRLAAEQAGYFKDRITGIVETFDSPPGSDVPRDLYDVVKTLDGLEFITTTTLYIPDPTERAVLWGFTAWRESYTNCDGFARFYVVKDFEKAMRKAVDGTPADLDRINALDRFTWYTLLSGSNGQARAVLRIDGDSRHSFRDYRLGQ
jgi:hypothetical protein